jgi:hypothetical protein
MFERELQHMYQAWCQDNLKARQDWYVFVERTALQQGVSADVVMRELQKYRWFEWEGE